MPYMIEAEGLVKCFGDARAVDSIDFQVDPGQCFGILGPNGAGKTTTLRMVLGQTVPTGGTLKVLNEPMPARRRVVRQRLGVVPQDDNLDPDFTVIENLYVYASYFGIHRRYASDRVSEILERVSLTDRATSSISALSGGMKRRLSIARALVNDPELLILDEPTTGLDPQVRHLVWSRLRELKRQGKTLVLTTHYMEEAERLCDELIVMDHGAIVLQGAPDELIRAHVEPNVVEVQGQDAVIEPVIALLRSDGIKIREEVVEETRYCYMADSSPLTQRLDALRQAKYFHRPANLEDVFLRLTGRELRD